MSRFIRFALSLGFVPALGSALSAAAVAQGLPARARSSAPAESAAVVVPVEPGSPRATVQAFLDAAHGNDLERAAIELCPDVGRVRNALSELNGALLARMSGSGATCFGLFAERGAAERAGQELARRRPAWWIAAADLLTADAEPAL